MKVFKSLILNLLALNLLFGVAATIEYGSDFLVEFSFEIDSDESLEGESEKEFEQDDENEKIVVLQSLFLAQHKISSIYASDEVLPDYFEKDHSPPPEM